MFGTAGSGALLRAGGSRTPETIRQGICLPQRRLFSVSSAQRAGTLVTFRKASTPKLQETLDTLYNKIILPSYLTQEQQKKIYRVKYERELQLEPVTMEIDGVVHKFGYQDMMKLPRTFDLVRESLKTMKTPGDLDNLPLMLEGIRHADRKIEDELFVQMIRRASDLHHLDVILSCVKAVKRTGFKLNTAEKVLEMLNQLASRAVFTGYGPATTPRALKNVQLIVELLEADLEHHRATEACRLTLPFHKHPFVLAHRLHMAVACNYYYGKRQDTDGSITRYAEAVMAVWPEGKGVKGIEPADAYTDRSRLRFLRDRNSFLYHATPLYQALSLSVPLVDPGLGMQLQNRADAVEAEIRAAIEDDHRKHGGRGEIMYNWIFNREEMKKQRAAELHAKEAEAKANEKRRQRQLRAKSIEGRRAKQKEVATAKAKQEAASAAS